MGAVSVFYTDDTFGKTGGVAIKGKKPCFIFQLGDNFLDNTQNGVGSLIATDFSIKKQENVAVTPTLGEQLFLYVGGETAWTIDVNGLAFLTCNGGDAGFDKVIQWYKDNNVKETGKSLKLVLGSQVYDGYLWKFAVQAEYKYLNAFSFTMSFVGVISKND